MTKLAIEKRLERLERLKGCRQLNRVKVYYADGSSRKLDVLTFACEVLIHPESAPVWYEPLGEIRAGKLLQIIDAVISE